VALIIALIGLQINMVSQRAYAIVIFMTAVTTLVPPPLLRYLFRDEMPIHPTMIKPEEERVQLG
jgi:Kef-type K+ transport system membrane component KefB